MQGITRVLIRQKQRILSADYWNVTSTTSYDRNNKTTSGLSSTLKRPRSLGLDRTVGARCFSSYDDQRKYIPPLIFPSQNQIENDKPTKTSNPSIGAQVGKDGPSDSFISHITSGGIPCDPAPAPFQLADFGEESLYTLVLLRHGESEWNKLNQYTGWVDVNLTAEGKKEARDAGRLLHENGIEIDHAFTSVLKRASFSCNMALNTAQQHWVPVTKSWRLNERHYGALQGYNKDTAFRELDLDQELVMQMRRSYDVRPPIMQDDHPYWHGKDRRCGLVCFNGGLSVVHSIDVLFLFSFVAHFVFHADIASSPQNSWNEAGPNRSRTQRTESCLSTTLLLLPHCDLVVDAWLSPTPTRFGRSSNRLTTLVTRISRACPFPPGFHYYTGWTKI